MQEILSITIREVQNNCIFFTNAVHRLYRNTVLKYIDYKNIPNLYDFYKEEFHKLIIGSQNYVYKSSDERIEKEYNLNIERLIFYHDTDYITEVFSVIFPNIIESIVFNNRIYLIEAKSYFVVNKLNDVSLFSTWFTNYSDLKLSDFVPQDTLVKLFKGENAPNINNISSTFAYILADVNVVKESDTDRILLKALGEVDLNSKLENNEVIINFEPI